MTPSCRVLRVDPHDPLPIFRQIEAGILRLIASSAFAPGAPIPSVREMAQDLGVNPATVVRAYQALTEDGVLVVRRGEGTFVANAPPSLSKRERAAALREAALRYASAALTAGAGSEEAAQSLREAFQTLKTGGRE